ncbi:MAG TPA: CoA transferase [Chloroflexi bacterium]|nr:CoA transferase [Chloroflexota bacterium]HAL27934.1 CoA transferase [Chloroflexota bacterium]
MATAALDGIRVLELGNYMAGPYAGTLLADMGADVVKIESPAGGDYSRGLGPFAPGSPDGAGFLRLDRNKRSVALDLKSDLGKRTFGALVARADVIIENLRAGTLDRLGLGYDALAAAYPRLIYCSITGFGRTGPYRDRAGLDLILQAESGLMSVTGEPGRPPVKVGVPAVDLASALYGAFAIATALIARERSGRGQLIDLSLLESGVSLAIWESGVYLTTGEVPGPLGSAHRVTAPYQAFKTADGYIAIGATSPPTWAAFCRVSGLERLREDPKWSDATRRREHAIELASIIEAVTVSKPTDEWMRSLSDAGVPCGRINDLGTVFADPHLMERGLFVDLPHPVLGSVRAIGSPLHLSDTPPVMRRAAPLLGEHTREVLGEAGVPPADIDALTASVR